MGVDDSGTLAALKAHRRELVDPKIAEHNGRIVKTTGDGLLLEFSSVVDAVRCAVEVQRGMGERNAGVASDKRLDFRIGINVGDIIIDGDDIFGDGVNVAARLEALADPGGICVSKAVRDQVLDKLSFPFEDLGAKEVKNIARPIEAYRVELGSDAPQVTPHGFRRWKRLARFRAMPWLGAGILTLGAVSVGAVLLVQHFTKSDPLPMLPAFSVAVLPYVATAGVAAETEFAERFTEDLSAALVRLRTIRVASPSAVASYVGKGSDARAVGRELNVRYVVEGQIRQDADQSVLKTRLVDATTGAEVWSDQNILGRSFNREERDILVIREARRLGIAIRNAQRIDPHQSPAMKLVLSADTMDISSREAVLEARRLYDEASRLQPDLVVALIRRGWNSVNQLELDPGSDRDSLADEALTFAKRATDIDGNDPQAWELKAVALGWQGRLDAAFEADARARQLNPSVDYNGRAWLLVMNGRPEEVLTTVKQANSMDPQAISNYGLMKCWAYALLGRYEEAIPACERWLAIDDWQLPHVLLTAAYAQSGNKEKAAREKAIVLQLIPGFSIARFNALWKSDSPTYQAMTEQHILAGLRKAGLPE
jgi:adenylate cyclase